MAAAVHGTVDDYGVVHGLAEEPSAVGRLGKVWHGVHVSLADVANHHRQTVLPDENLLVVAGAGEAPVLVDKCYF